MTDPTERFATPRVAAGALFVHEDRILLVRKTYGERWDIPGGYVDRGESPAQACRREIREELGLAWSGGRLLVMDWAPRPSEGDKILFIFDGGYLTDSGTSIQLDHRELDGWDWISVGKIEKYLNDRLLPRVENAIYAHRSGKMITLENGQA